MTARRVLFAASAWLLCAAAAGQGIADACATRAPDDTRGIAALEAACPGTEAALQATGLVANLPAGWRDSINPAALRDLAALEQRYQRTPASAPDHAGLPAILDQLASEQVQPHRSWWEIVQDWLRSWFASPERASSSWFDDFLERLSQSRALIHALTYALLAIAVIAAVAFIVNELRIAGVLTRSSPRRAAGAVITPAQQQAEDIGDLDTAAPADQPAILLRLLVAQLVARGALGGERSLTHSELAARAALPDADSHENFARVSRLAERILYGHDAPDAHQARAVVTDGRSLLLQLQATGEARP